MFIRVIPFIKAGSDASLWVYFLLAVFDSAVFVLAVKSLLNDGAAYDPL